MKVGIDPAAAALPLLLLCAYAHADSFRPPAVTMRERESEIVSARAASPVSVVMRILLSSLMVFFSFSSVASFGEKG